MTGRVWHASTDLPPVDVEVVGWWEDGGEAPAMLIEKKDQGQRAKMWMVPVGRARGAAVLAHKGPAGSIIVGRRQPCRRIALRKFSDLGSNSPHWPRLESTRS